MTSRENIAERVREITDGKGVPVVYDSVGKDTLDGLARQPAAARRAGEQRHVVGAGPDDSNCSPRKGSIWITRPAMMHYIDAAPAHARHGATSCSTTVLRRAHRGASRSESFALADAAEAHRALGGRKTTGGTVLVLGG